MTNCQNQKKNLQNCSCTYERCSRKGICCQCLSYHRQSNELPACFFDPAVEKTFDRSMAKFIETNR